MAKVFLKLADETAENGKLAKQGLRLNSAISLLQAGSFTEAYFVSWTLIETALGREFEQVLNDLGRSNTEISKLNWTASHQIEFLNAVDRLSNPVRRQLHVLRRRRNDIVHKLYDATREEAKEAFTESNADTKQYKLTARVLA